MSRVHIHDQGDLAELRRFLHEQCNMEGCAGFVLRLAKETSRWSTVEDLLCKDAKNELNEIAFRPRSSGQGFSVGNLKAHYVLDEEFINNGSAIILFSIIGVLWTHVEYVGNQNAFTTAAAWLEEEKS